MDNKKLMLKGFNQGYLLRMLKPKLAQKLCDGFKDKDNPYQSGFLTGTKQALKEQMKSKLRHYKMGKTNFPSPDKTRSKEKDHGKDFRDR